ncbi:MAG: hypothetical protein WA793_07735 [Sphingorhabdus sp.]|uniref:hypothetical protein n=1 Tax=Sphingorhabdus sp. TaxID=1902408 RepID=UPI003CB63F11
MIAGTVYFLILFALGFVLGTIRVLIIAPRLGELAATSAEIPVMLIAAYFTCRRTMHHWHVPHTALTRGIIALWFLILLVLFETLLGKILFGRTMAAQWAVFATPAGLLGLSAQIIAATLPVFVGKKIGN